MSALKTTGKTTGLRYWMARVLDECEHVAADFSADPVHDLRVSLRRCRSMADGMIAMDPDREWKAMKKAGKRLFQRLGDLRDVQIMMEWIEKLEPEAVETAGSPVSQVSADGDLAGAVDARSGEPRAMSGLSTFGDPAARALLQILRAREGEQK
ncbi:MAG TPA: CHAD domain-containing protein, partial [Terracidiphilus sp.]